MNLEFSLMGAVVAVAWSLALPPATIVSVVIAALAFFSKSIPVNILFFLSLNLLAFIRAILGGKKSVNGRTQKRYMLVFFGSFCALIGSAIPNPAASYPLVFFGLLLSISNGVSSFFFYAHYEALSLTAYLESVVIPAFVAINILLKIKTGLKAENTQLWDVTLLALGLFTFLVSSLLALSKRRLKAVLIYLSQAWIGLLLFLMVMDVDQLTSEVFAAFGISTISSIMLLNVSSKLGRRFFAFAKIASLALPGAVGFTALYLALRMTISLNIGWLVVFGFGYLLQAITLIGARPGVVEPTRKLQIRFGLIVLVQFVSGLFLLWMDKGGMK